MNSPTLLLKLRRSVILFPGLGFLLVALSSLVPKLSEAQVVVSSEITTTIQGVAHSDEDAPFLAIQGLSFDVGELPIEAALSAIGVDSGGNALFAVETTTSLPGGLVAEPRDVIRFDGSDFSLIFDGSTEGIPRNARIDGISFRGQRLLSFDTTIRLGRGLVVADEDVVEWAAGGFVSPLYLDGSEAGLDAGLDIDAIDAWSPLHITVSFDTSGIVGGLPFDDDDLLTYDRKNELWFLNQDPSALEPGLEASDVTGLVYVPEPTGLGVLGFGLLQTALWGRRRRRKSGRRQAMHR